MADAFRWEDDTGRTRWQPQVDNGQLLWHDWWWGGAPTWRHTQGAKDTPFLCRWRWYARWKAHREERRRARFFHPADDSDV